METPKPLYIRLSSSHRRLHLLVHTPRSLGRTLLPPLQTFLVSTTALPRTDNQIHNMLHPLPVLDNCKHSRTPFPHLRRIPLHHSQIRTHRLGKINLVHHQQIRARDTGSSLPGNLVPTCNVDHVDDEIGQLARVVGGEVVTTGLDEEEVGLELTLQGLKGEQVGADIFADGSVGAAARLNGTDARRGEGFVAGEELGVFPV